MKPTPYDAWVDSSHEADQIIIQSYYDALDKKILRESLFAVTNERLKLAYEEYVKGFLFVFDVKAEAGSL